MTFSLNVTRCIAEFLVVFSVGSGGGWWLEFFYRGIRRKGKIVNPGFLSGPYLPIYGFGAFFLYLAGKIPAPFWQQVLVFMVSAVLMELLTGLFFVRFFNLRLWDYSEEWGNLKGQICPRFAVYWMLIGAVGLYWIVPLLKQVVAFLNANIHYSFFLGLYYGVILSDVVNSFQIAARLSAIMVHFREREFPRILDYRKFRLHLRTLPGRLSVKGYLGRFLFPFNNMSKVDMESHILGFAAKIREGSPIRKILSSVIEREPADEDGSRPKEK